MFIISSIAYWILLVFNFVPKAAVFFVQASSSLRTQGTQGFVRFQQNSARRIREFGHVIGEELRITENARMLMDSGRISLTCNDLNTWKTCCPFWCRIDPDRFAYFVGAVWRTTTTRWPIFFLSSARRKRRAKIKHGAVGDQAAQVFEGQGGARHSSRRGWGIFSESQNMMRIFIARKTWNLK